MIRAATWVFLWLLCATPCVAFPVEDWAGAYDARYEQDDKQDKDAKNGKENDKKDNNDKDKKEKDKKEKDKKDEDKAKTEKKDKKPPKALFEWAIGKDDKKDEDEPDKKDNGDKEGNGEGNGADNDNGEQKGNGKKGQNGDDEEEDDDTIETDRPDFVEASSTVGKGRIQLEAGYTFIRDRSDGATTRTHSYPEALLRIGLCAEWFELRLGQNLINSRTSGGNGGGTTVIAGPAEGIATQAAANVNGAEDLYLGVKLALTEQKKYLPEMALVLQTTVPTGSPGLSARELLPGVNFLAGWDIIKDCLTLGTSLQANRSRDDEEHFYVETAAAATVGFQFTPKLGMYTEWFALLPTGALDPGIGPEHYADGGFTYKITPNFQLDVRAGVGLNRHADDFFAGSGFAIRY